MRIEGWETRLNDVIEAALYRPFRWGENDCCLFAAECVKAVTGADVGSPYRGLYDSAQGAACLLDELGGLEGAVRFAGFPEIPPAMAQRGDLAIAPNDGREVLGIVDMTARQIAVPGENGLMFLPVSVASKAWRVC